MGPLFFLEHECPYNLIDYLEEGSSLNEFLDDFPTVSREHAVAVLELMKQAVLSRAAAA